MSTKSRRERLQNDGYEFHSEFKIEHEVVAEFYTKDGDVFHWFPDHSPQDLQGGEWKKAAAMNEYKRLCKEMEEGEGELNVRELAGSWWNYIVSPKKHMGWMDNYDVLQFTYYKQPFAAVKREALTNHFDEAMDRVEDLVNAQWWPERKQIIAETAAWIFFGEPGKIAGLEQEYGVAR